MAPSVRSNRRQQSKQQPTLSSFSRISKPITATNSGKTKSSAAKELAIEQLEEKKPIEPAPTAIKSTKSKRKRSDTDSEDDHGGVVEFFSSSKRTKLQLPTPPRSPSKQRFAIKALPNEAQVLVDIFAAFCKAFALHRAHNGQSTPAEVGQLLESVTRIYHKRSVIVKDLQQIFGIFEQTAEIKEVRHAQSPFKLSTVGIGSGRQQLVEYAGAQSFSENNLQARFRNEIHAFLQTHETIHDGPRLTFEVDVRTTIRQNKATDKMDRIMSGRKAELSMDKLSISDASDKSLSQTTIKSRTLSLFDRIKAKQLANAAVSAPSADVLRRKHAVARMAEVIEILRMRQQQRLRGCHGPGVGARVSFAMQQIVSELKVSMVIPMGEDEIRLCLNILAKEVNDGWCSIVELGATKSLVLSGTVRSAQEILKTIQV